MKKFLALLLTLLLCCSIAACNKSIPTGETMTQGDVTAAAKKYDLKLLVTINPQFEIYLNERWEILAVQCLNYDASSLFNGSNPIQVVNLSYAEAMDTILAAAKDMNYVGEEGAVTIEPILPNNANLPTDLQDKLLTPAMLDFQQEMKVDFVVEDPIAEADAPTFSTPEQGDIKKEEYGDGTYSTTQILSSGEKVETFYNSDDVQIRKNVYNSAGTLTSEWISGLLWSPNPDPHGYATTTFYDTGEIKEQISVSMDGKHGRSTYTRRYDLNGVQTYSLNKYADGCSQEETYNTADQLISRTTRSVEDQSYREDFYTYYRNSPHVFLNDTYEEFVDDGVNVTRTSTSVLYENGWLKSSVTDWSDGRRHEEHYDELGRRTKWVGVGPGESGKLERIEHSIVYHVDGSCTFTLDYSEDIPSVYEYDAQYVQENMVNHNIYCHCSNHDRNSEFMDELNEAAGITG